MVDAFIKIGNLKGESQDSDHNDGWMDVLSYSWGMQNAAQVSGGGMAAGHGYVNDFNFTKRCDSSSVDLAKQLMIGVHHDTATFEVRKAGGQSKGMVYFKIEFEDVYATSIQFGGSGEEPGTFMESVAIVFKKYKASYWEQASDGSQGAESTYGYDLALKEEC